MDPKVSMIIPTYNHLDKCLRPCLESIIRHTDFETASLEVIVVANGCKDGTCDYVRSLGSPFRLLTSDDPLGFVGATNAGASIAIGEYLLFLNDDVELLDWAAGNAWLHMMMDPLEEDPKLAIVGSNRDAWTRNRYFIVMFCAMTRRDLFFRMGMLDQAFGTGCGEDCDYSMKVQDAGMTIRQVPQEHDKWITSFPIWHIGHVTFNSIMAPKATKNANILEERYPRTEEDKEFNKRFSAGLQNCH